MLLLEEALFTSSAGTLYTFMVLDAGLDLCPIADSDWGWDPVPRHCESPGARNTELVTSVPSSA